MATSGDRTLERYIKGRANDPIARLQARLDSGAETLTFDKKWGYLPAFLRAMKIPESTQTLVFSRTSFQINYISRRTPRALYFNDDVYVGWVQGGPVLEVASVDPELGTILMVLTHQTELHNLISKVSYDVRSAVQDEGASTPVSEITRTRIRSAAEPLVIAMLFGRAPEFTGPITGTSGFAGEFAKQGPFDRKGRSLRKLDLQKRLFRYPLSYLIYSESFDAMPAPAKEYVYRRLPETLTGADKNIVFGHLSESDRTDVLQILEDTKPDFRAYSPM